MKVTSIFQKIFLDPPIVAFRRSVRVPDRKMHQCGLLSGGCKLLKKCFAIEDRTRDIMGKFASDLMRQLLVSEKTGQKP